MKKLIHSISALLPIVFFLYSCKEDVNLIDGFSETPIVYGLLDKADSVHFIKINRAFIGPGNYVEIAKIPDSSYFKEVYATINEIGGLNRSWILDDTLIENKEQNGVWYAPEQKVYYFKTSSKEPLNPDARYTLEISINNGSIKVSGETELVDGLSLDSNTPSSGGFGFVDKPGEYLTPSLKLSGKGNSVVVNASIEVDFAEIDGPKTIERSYLWKIGEAPLGSEFSGFRLSGETFFTLMKKNVSLSPSITKRLFRGLRIILVGGSEELYNYIVVNKPVSSLAQSKPTYTNLKVEGTKRVVGIFSSRQTLTVWKPFYLNSQTAFARSINKKTTRELCEGPMTGELLFCSDHPGDNMLSNPESFACK